MKARGGKVASGEVNGQEYPSVLAARIGRVVRKLRSEARLTVQEVADRSGISQPFLTQIENGRSAPSLVTLHRIAHSIGTSAQSLLAEDGATNVSLVRSKHGPSYPVSEGSTARFLINGRRTLGATELTAAPASSQGAHLEHAGEELVYVVEGQIEFMVGDRTEILKRGDALWYPATDPHSWCVVGRTPAKFLMISTPPSF